MWPTVRVGGGVFLAEPGFSGSGTQGIIPRTRWPVPGRTEKE